MMEKKPTFWLASEAIKHFKNKNYGLAGSALMDLWEILASEHYKEAARKRYKEQEKQPD